MNTQIVSSTEIQRNIKNVLEKLNASNEPLIVVRDSIPAAVMISYAEFRRISEIEKKLLRERMKMVLKDMGKRNRRISDKELNADIEEARRVTHRS